MRTNNSPAFPEYWGKLIVHLWIDDWANATLIQLRIANFIADYQKASNSLQAGADMALVISNISSVDGSDAINFSGSTPTIVVIRQAFAMLLPPWASLETLLQPQRHTGYDVSQAIIWPDAWP